MRKNFIYAFAFFAALTTIVSCKNEDVDKQHYDNRIYISASKFTEDLLIKPSLKSTYRELTVSAASPVNNNIDITFRGAPELISYYREAYYDSDVVLLDSKYYSLDNPKTQIQVGSVLSTPVRIQFSNLNELDMFTRYVLPVTISDISGGINILNSSRTVFYIFKGAALINVVADMAKNRAKPMFDNAAHVKDMSAFTLEALVHPNVLQKATSSIMGSTATFLIRVGDIGMPSNQIQIASIGLVLTSADYTLETGKWQHVAVTFKDGFVEGYLDGVLKCSGTSSEQTVDFSEPWTTQEYDTRFWVGHSYENARYFDGLFSEVRIWNKALTVEEINTPSHFYEVDPSSEGLVAYWKFDNGSGKIITDYSPYKCDLETAEEPAWVKVTLPEKN